MGVRREAENVLDNTYYGRKFVQTLLASKKLEANTWVSLYMEDITNYEFLCIDIPGKNLYPLFLPSGIAMNHYHGGVGFGIDSVGNNKYVSFYFRSTTNLEVLDYATDGSCSCSLYGYK